MNKIVVLLLFLSPSLFAQTVYKTVENGVTSYSDSPPESGAAEVLTIDAAAPVDAGLTEQRLAEMRDTTDRMARDRREREEHRATLREMNQASGAQPEVPAPVSGTTAWQGNYWPGVVRPISPRPPFRPGRPKPLPAVPVHSVPGWSVMQPGNAQLMRPIVSSRKP